MLTDQMIEGLLDNADDGDVFTGLRYKEAARFQTTAFYKCGVRVRIETEDLARGLYRAVVSVPDEPSGAR